MTRADNHVGDARLQRWALDELTADEHGEVEAHLSGCEHCRRRAEAERRVDELLLAASPAPPPGSSARAFERLWAAVDEDGAGSTAYDATATPAQSTPDEPASVIAGRWGWRRVASVAAAAALLVWVVSGLWEPAAEPLEPRDERLVDEGHEPAEPIEPPQPFDAQPLGVPPIDAPPFAVHGAELAIGFDAVASPVTDGAPLPLAEPAPSSNGAVVAVAAPSLDQTRLAAARERVAEVLRLADEHAPFDAELFMADCREGLAELWRDDWPVTALVRGHALGADPLTALPALRWAAAEPAGAPILAAALDDPARQDEVLVLLEQDPAPLGSSSVLRRGLEQLARAEHGQQALAILASSTDADSRRSLERVLQRLASDVRGDEQLLALCAALETVPVELAVPTLLAVGADVISRPETRSRVDALAASLVRRGRAAVLAAVGEHGARDERLDWLPMFSAQGLHELAPVLVERLHDEPGHAALLDALRTLGGPRVARGLLEVWRQQRYRRTEAALLSSLATVLLAAPELAGDLAAGWHDARVDDLVALADALPETLRGPLLAGALPPFDGDARMRSSGQTERLLVALARHGSAEDGAAVVAWIETRPPTDDLLALAWATAGSLDPSAAEAAWARVGGDPADLREVSQRSGPRFAADRPPARRDLQPLRDSLRRASAPPR